MGWDGGSGGILGGLRFGLFDAEEILAATHGLATIINKIGDFPSVRAACDSLVIGTKSVHFGDDGMEMSVLFAMRKGGRRTRNISLIVGEIGDVGDGGIESGL